MNQGVRYCCGYTYKDFTVGSQFSSKWSSASTLAASGGTYTFSYDIDTNKLTKVLDSIQIKCAKDHDI